MSEEFKKLNDIILTDKVNSKKLYYREACRGIIFDNDLICVLKSKKYGEYIIPGGGINPNETLIEALKREVQEETGIIIKNPIPYAYITEYRDPIEKDLELFKMKSYYFFCEIESVDNPMNMDAYEIEFGYYLTKVTLDEAIQNNRNLIENKKIVWLHRELAIFEELKKVH